MNHVTEQQKLRAKRRKRRQLIRRSLILVILIAIGAFAWPYVRSPDSPATVNPDTEVAAEAAQQTSKKEEGIFKEGADEFDVLTPKDEDATSLKGWTLTPPSKGSPFFAYSDTINGVNIKVSQQPLPERFAKNPSEQLQETAKGFSANRSFDTPDGTEAFIGTSAKGPQSLIMIKNELLILIVSDTALNDTQWSKYIDSLS